MNIEELYVEGMQPQRMGWLVRPLRRLLFRVLRPYFVILLRAAEDPALEQRVASLEARTRAASAVIWDREAVVRRLAAIEDALAEEWKEPGD